MPFEALKMIIDVGFGFDLVAAIQKINEDHRCASDLFNGMIFAIDAIVSE